VALEVAPRGTWDGAAVNGAVVAGGVAFLVAGALVPLLVSFAIGRNLLDVPNLRSSHEAPTPRLGGVAIILGAWVGFALVRPEGTWPLLVAATFIGAVGLADDLSDLHFGAKAAAQTLVASGLLFFYPPPIVSDTPGEAWGIAAFGIGVFWIVALSNAFNFMDGIDGLVGGVAVVNTLFLAALAGEAGALLPELAGATAGFLVWNISPASIFAGDSGAYFLGFGLAVVALYAPMPQESWTPLGFVSCTLIFTPLLFDIAYTLVRRLRTGVGKDIFSAHREHIYQRITPATGLHRRTSNLYYGMSVVAGFAALLAGRGGASMLAGITLALACCAFLAALPRLILPKE
jgi:UDP-N-acetylmuramyl pentapeptide phosphotransferase/UDP-N-acetylglucosamine-1-phosphate transferase